MRQGRLYNRLCQMSFSGNGTVPGIPLIEIIADKRVLIENHRGIHRYTREIICVETAIGIVRIKGQMLFLEKMSYDQLTITGNIDGVMLCRGGKNAD